MSDVFSNQNGITGFTWSHHVAVTKCSWEGMRMWKRLGWMVLIWIASVAALGVIAFAIKLLMKAVRLSV